ncbi:perlucin-like protein [Crassostrea virginica]
MVLHCFSIILGVVLTFSSAVDGTACNDGWIHYQTSCYLFKDSQENWASAGYICSALNGKLVEIESSVENMFLKNHIAVLHQNHKYDNVNYWVGGTDLEAEGTYLWVSTRDRFSYTDWHPSQPNGGPEDCVAFNCFTDSSIQWHDFQCSHMNYYICEKELSDTELNNIIG